jgi:ferredoxin
MRIAWNQDRCRQHGQCEIAAPDLFRLEADGCVHVTEEVPAGLEDDAWAAADACPEQAINIIEIEEIA